MQVSFALRAVRGIEVRFASLELLILEFSVRSNDRPVTFAVSTAIEAPTLADIAFIRVTEYVRRIPPAVSSWRGMSGPWSGIVLFARDSALMLRAQ
jgi:hypothetical protein